MSSEVLSGSFFVERGVKQGSVLSPALFLMVLLALCDDVESMCLVRECKENGGVF